MATQQSIPFEMLECLLGLNGDVITIQECCAFLREIGLRACIVDMHWHIAYKEPYSPVVMAAIFIEKRKRHPLPLTQSQILQIIAEEQRKKDAEHRIYIQYIFNI